MKVLLPVLFFFGLCIAHLNAQIEAITTNGDTVLLFDDGQWNYKANAANNTLEESVDMSTLPQNPTPFVKPKKSKDIAKGKNGAYEIWYDAKKWEREMSKTYGDSDIELNRLGGEGFAMCIFERAEMPLSILRDVALSNARKVATDFELVKEEMRVVNGKKVLCLKFNSTVKGIKFTYMGYYSCFPGGTLQVLTMTFENLFEELEPDFLDLLNGLEIKD